MFVPEGVVTNERMSRLMDTSDEWIRQRTGIAERRYARKGTSSSDLGFEAAKRALDDAGLGARDLDLIVFTTMTPDHYFPGNGGLLAQKLGLETTHALDIRMQCAGFLSGLQVADAFVRSGSYRRVLLVDNLIISGQTMSRFATMVDELGATVIGIGTLWNSADDEIAGHPVFGLLNTLYKAHLPDECPLCQNGGPPAETVPY